MIEEYSNDKDTAFNLLLFYLELTLSVLSDIEHELS